MFSGIEDDEVVHNGDLVSNHQQNNHHQISQQAKVICSKQSQQHHQQIQHQVHQQVQHVQCHSKPLTHIVASSPQPQPPPTPPQVSNNLLRSFYSVYRL